MYLDGYDTKSSYLTRMRKMDGKVYYTNSTIGFDIPYGTTRIADGEYSGTSAMSVILPNSVTGIGNNAFGGCQNLTDIIIPDSVTSIGERAFEFCCGLSSITIPSSVTMLGKAAFRHCVGLRNVTFSSFNLKIIEEDLFCGCNGLTNVTIPWGVMRIESMAFSCCRGLKSIIIPSSVRFIDDMAFLLTEGFTIFAPKGSYAEEYAKKKGISFFVDLFS